MSKKIIAAPVTRNFDALHCRPVYAGNGVVHTLFVDGEAVPYRCNMPEVFRAMGISGFGAHTVEHLCQFLRKNGMTQKAVTDYQVVIALGDGRHVGHGYRMVCRATLKCGIGEVTVLRKG